MNKNKVRDIISQLSDILDKDSLDNEEYLVFIANLLISFGKTGIESDGELSSINVNDSIEVEYALNAFPANPYLASILQGHAILKWSEFFKE